MVSCCVSRVTAADLTETVVDMVSKEDREQLARATELLRDVIERHRNEDLRMLSVFNSAIQDIRIGQRYLDAASETAQAIG